MTQVIRKDDLIAMLQAIEGNPVIVMEKDGGEYWGTYLEAPELTEARLHQVCDNQLFIGHQGDTSGRSKYVTLDDSRYVVIK
jgi:hypothetical protein